MQRNNYPKLRNCPFCGENEVVVDKTLVSFEPKEYMYRICCANTRCPVTVETNLCHNIEDAVKAWNRRSDND